MAERTGGRWETALDAWLTPFLAAMNHKARRR